MSQAITLTTLTESLRCHEVESVSSPPRVVDGVSEPGCVYDGEPQFDSFLLDADSVFDDADGLIDSLYEGDTHEHGDSTVWFCVTFLFMHK